MTVVEANPTISYKASDMFSLAFGARAVYSDATVRSAGNIVAVPAGGLGGGLPATPEYTYISRDMDGDTTEYGYNLALSVKPTNKLALAATYRSEIDLDMEGSGIFYASNSYFNGLCQLDFTRGLVLFQFPCRRFLHWQPRIPLTNPPWNLSTSGRSGRQMVLRIFPTLLALATRFLRQPSIIR